MATQAERTARTTARLMDATIDVLIERGYRGTSTTEICKRARSSRGAQLHHYPTKQALVAAAVEHLVTRRMAEVGRRLARAPGGLLNLKDAAAFIMKLYASETFYAWLELVVASRTDARLRRLMAEVDARITAAAEELCRHYLMPEEKDAKAVAARTRLILSILDGLAVHRIISGGEALPKSALREAAQLAVFARRTGARLARKEGRAA